MRDMESDGGVGVSYKVKIQLQVERFTYGRYIKRKVSMT